MRTTFNKSRDKSGNKSTGLKHMNGRIEDFKKFIEWEQGEDEDLRDNGDGELCPFHQYGLGIGYVAQGTFTGQRKGYLRYQLSYGGPSDEVRFYYAYPGDRTPDRIEYVYMDWGTGIGFDVSGEDWAQWLWEWLEGCGTTKIECERELNEAGLL